MARITIEDCTEKVDDRFKLVALAAQRAKDINSGSAITIRNEKKNKNDKATVIALREIAAGYINVSALREELIRRLQTKRKIEPVNDISTDSSVDNNVDNFDYIPGGSDLYVTDDYSDLDDNQVFCDTGIDSGDIEKDSKS